MKEKKLFVKMFIVFVSFFVLFILSNSQVFAFNYDGYDYPDLSTDDDYSYILYLDLRKESASPFIFCYLSDSKIFLNADTNYLNVKGKFKRYVFKNNVWKLDGDFGSHDRISVIGVLFNEETNFFMNSNYVVLDSNGKKVFQPAKGTILVPIAKSMDFLAVIKEILGILPMILVVLIGLLGLMKAIRQMLKMLHQA